MTQETGLIIVARTGTTNGDIALAIQDSEYHGEFNAVENFWFFPEEENCYDALEDALEEMFYQKGVFVRFEGVWN